MKSITILSSKLNQTANGQDNKIGHLAFLSEIENWSAHAVMIESETSKTKTHLLQVLCLIFLPLAVMTRKNLFGTHSIAPC